MKIIDIHKAKTQLSKLVNQAVNGQPFIIAKAGKPLVKVIKLDITEKLATKRIGFMKGQIQVPEDFDAMGRSEITRRFEGTLD
jgi:prevent-host-death family protein